MRKLANNKSEREREKFKFNHHTVENKIQHIERSFSFRKHFEWNSDADILQNKSDLTNNLDQLKSLYSIE